MSIKQSLLSLLFFCLSVPSVAQGITRYVDPRIGSVGLGRTFVGPCMPFGMAKPCPDAVSMPNAGWAPAPEALKGFSQTHVSGTGGGQKYGNILVQPYDPQTATIKETHFLLPNGDIASVSTVLQQRASEEIALGRYACTYADGIRTEVTASARCAFYRFSAPRKMALLIDAASFLGMDTIPNKREGQFFVRACVSINGKKEVVGYQTVRGGWNNGDPYTVYFCLQTSRPFSVSEHDSLSVVLHLPKTVEVKVGISYISIDQARRNIPRQRFDEQLSLVRQTWQQYLARVPYQGSEKEMRMFYTALYHTLLMPTDKTGENPHWQGGPYYDDYYAIWDTYRTSFPLLMDYYPKEATAMVNSLLAIYQHDGYMPDARSGDCNGRTQGGSNAEAVIWNAYRRHLKGIDYHLALEAMLKDAEVPPTDDEREGRGGLREYNALGYIPYGIPRAGTRTVEYSFDDWCIAQVAHGLGHDDLFRKYIARSRNWRNLWRSDYEWQGMRGFIMPREAPDHWRDSLALGRAVASDRWLDSVPWGRSKVFHPTIPYRPDTKVAPWYLPWWDTFFYEALSAEYSLSVPHDVPGLIEVCGGDSLFRRRLDTFFDEGHYNIANEPSFLTPYLYMYIGRRDLTEQRLSAIINANFSDTPTGLPGNDDSGAMSSWLLWAMMGRYPIPTADGYLRFSPVRISGMAVTSSSSPSSAPAVTVGAASAAQEPSPSWPPASLFRSSKLGAPRSVSFTLNRQYRTWNLGYVSEEGALCLRCHGASYVIPIAVIDSATSFDWSSPQKGASAVYHCKGTFLFISRQAMETLLATGSFVYDGITWRELDRTDASVHVRADVDGTEMWISRTMHLPFVLRMQGNPLGIDWRLAPPPYVAQPSSR